jgi:hypothetical protein
LTKGRYPNIYGFLCNTQGIEVGKGKITKAVLREVIEVVQKQSGCYKVIIYVIIRYVIIR